VRDARSTSRARDAVERTARPDYEPLADRLEEREVGNVIGVECTFTEADSDGLRFTLRRSELRCAATMMPSTLPVQRPSANATRVPTSVSIRSSSQSGSAKKTRMP
jgi:hypothetical protein